MDTTANDILSRRLRRRRGSSFVTKVACTECRKGRAKCDGLKPCARCASRGEVTCEYEVSVRIRKEELRQEVRELRRYRRASEKVFESLSTDGRSDFIIHKLRQNERLEDIYEQLNGFSPIAGSLGSENLSQGRYKSVQSNGSDDDSQSKIGCTSPGLNEAELDSFKHGSRWTELGLSDTVVEHLLLLYFCWEYPIFSSLSKRHFAQDFNTGRGRYCSSLLVNAILAVGCLFSDQIEARMDPHDSETAGMHCYAEAERLLLCHKDRSVTVVQAMSLMSSWNTSWGDYRKARFYAGQSMRMAVEMGLHRDNSTDETKDFHEVCNLTFWGAFMLDQAWSLVAGCLPQISQDSVLVGEPTAFNRDELREWIPYAGDQIPPGLDLRQPSNIRAVHKSLCELSTIIHKTLYVMYAHTDSLTSWDILDRYTQILGWYGSLPDVLRLGGNSTPSVLFVHIYYHFSIILIFYPLMNLRFLDSNVSALELCIEAANAIVSLVRSYESIHGLRRTPCFLPYIILASGIAHLGTAAPRVSPIDTMTQSAQEVAILQIMSLYHGSSKRASRVLLSRVLYPSSASGSHDKESEEGAYWEPFVTTMICPPADGRRGSSSVEVFMRIRDYDRAPTNQDQQGGYGFKRITSDL